MELPNLAGVISAQDVESKGSGSYKADYISWARTMQLLHQHAPGWLPDAIPAEGGCLLHNAAVGCYLLIRFVHTDGTVTPAVPQAVMDNRNNAIPFDKITARDITDTHRRGLAMAAALQFGLASELWAGNMGENPYRPEPAKAPSGNGKTIPATQQKPSSNGSKPPASEFITINGDPELDGEIRPEVVFNALRSVNAERRQLIKDGFMAAHYPSIFEAAQKEKKPVPMGPKNVNTDELLADLVERIHQTNPTPVAA